jgi:hypothetical protein
MPLWQIRKVKIITLRYNSKSAVMLSASKFYSFTSRNVDVGKSRDKSLGFGFIVGPDPPR